MVVLHFRNQRSTQSTKVVGGAVRRAANLNRNDCRWQSYRYKYDPALRTVRTVNNNLFLEMLLYNFSGECGDFISDSLLWAVIGDFGVIAALQPSADAYNIPCTTG